MCKKRFFLLSLLVCLCFVLHGCSGTKDKLVVATHAEFPPYEYKDGNEFKGIDIEIAKLISETMDKELEVLDIEFASIIPAIVNGKADIALAGLTVTPDRKENVAFSDTYLRATQSVLVKQDSDIKNINNMKDKKIGVQTGNTADIYCTNDFGEKKINRFSKHIDAVEALKNKKIDAIVLDNEPAKVFDKENDEVVMLDDVYCEEEYAIAVNKDNKDLLEQINNILSEIKSSGQLDEIMKKYIKW